VTRETEGETERDRRYQRELFDEAARRQEFTAELRQRLGSRAEVGLTLEANVTMARVRGASFRG
jgi:hypothetical protein